MEPYKFNQATFVLSRYVITNGVITQQTSNNNYITIGIISHSHTHAHKYN